MNNWFRDLIHCPECETMLSAESDIDFVETGATVGFIATSKRFSVATCATREATVGSGVAGAKA